jgi:hypothetical protein
MGASEDDPYTRSRLSLQALAEHVLSAARHAATGRIGLQAAPGGYATPPFPSEAGARTVAVDGTELVVADAGGERRAPITTLRAAGRLGGVEPGAPRDVYEPSTPLDLDAELVVRSEDARVIARFYSVVDEALADLRGERPGGATGAVQLWPEHFDLAVTLGEANYGGSPGDDGHPRPYAYVGPWQPPRPDGGFWNEPFGASRTVTAADDAVSVLAFLRDGRDRLA